MLEINFKGSPRMIVGAVVILLLCWGIIYPCKFLIGVYIDKQNASLKNSRFGPWGDIVTKDIMIDLPDEFVDIPQGSQTNQWFFADYTWDRVLDLLKSARLSDEALHSLITDTPWSYDRDGIRIMPTDHQILELSPESRSILYPTLTGMSANSDEKEVICFKPEILEQQLRESGLSSHSIALLRRLLYRNPKSPLLIFSDWKVALRQIPDDAEKRLFIKTLSRKPSLLADIRITPETDISKLANYWGIGGQRKDIESFLSSVHQVKSGLDVSLIYLLPPFARSRLYTYPFPSVDGTSTKQDCFWTAFNTFNITPDDQMSELEYVRKNLERDYYQIFEPQQLGDIILLSIGEKKVIHAATFIADDIVFTKNGHDFTQPWVLMRTQDMIDTYAARFPATTPQMLYFRKKAI